jgi:hypothetical protein
LPFFADHGFLFLHSLLHKLNANLNFWNSELKLHSDTHSLYSEMVNTVVGNMVPSRGGE